MKISDIIKKDQDLIKGLVSCKTYRPFLHLYFTELKKSTKSVSLGQLAMKSGLSKSLIKGIIDGNRRITPKTIGPIRKALSLPPLLNEYFFYLVGQEVPEIMEVESPAKARGLVKKYAQLVLEEYSSSTDSDEFFKDISNPVIYASLGTYEEGATINEITTRSRLPLDVIKKSIKNLQEIGAIKEREGRLYANRQFLFRASSKKGGNFYHYYLAGLEQQERMVKRSFEDNQKLFYSNVFSVSTEDIKSIREDLLELLNRYSRRSENPDGDQVISLQASLF